MTDLLVVEELRRPGLEPAHLRVAAGACAAVLGGSGSGKSLLLRAIADLDVNEGEVTLDGKPRSVMAAPAWRRRVVYVPAESGWWRDRVGEHFDDPDGVVGVLHRLGLPADCMDWEVARLSTGERQRLALARALSLALQLHFVLTSESMDHHDSEDHGWREHRSRRRWSSGRRRCGT